jgi:phosphate transport system substrate-binding protein
MRAVSVSVTLLGVVALAMIAITQAEARGNIRIVGATTIYPYSVAVAKRFTSNEHAPMPEIVQNGTGDGVKQFCAGPGEDTPDIANGGRRIKPAELAECAKNGVTEVVELKIGYDAAVVTRSNGGPGFVPSARDYWLALAADVPIGGQMVPNPYKTWRDVNPDLPAVAIKVVGQRTGNAIRELFVEHVLSKGCADVPEIKAISDKKLQKAACETVRGDGPYIDIGDDQAKIVEEVTGDRNALGVMSISMADRNKAQLHSLPIEGVEPTYHSIAVGEYAMSRSLYLYVKKAHLGVIPGLREYLVEFASDSASGYSGYLIEAGLLPLIEEERDELARQVRVMDAMTSIN